MFLRYETAFLLPSPSTPLSPLPMSLLAFESYSKLKPNSISPSTIPTRSSTDAPACASSWSWCTGTRARDNARAARCSRWRCLATYVGSCPHHVTQRWSCWRPPVRPGSRGRGRVSGRICCWCARGRSARRRENGCENDGRNQTNCVIYPIYITMYNISNQSCPSVFWPREHIIYLKDSINGKKKYIYI